MIVKKNSFSGFFRLRDSYGAFMDNWINCFGVFKLRVIEAAVHYGNTRLRHMYVAMGHIGILSI